MRQLPQVSYGRQSSSTYSIRHDESFAQLALEIFAFGATPEET